MAKTTNGLVLTSAIAKVFDDADNSSAGFAARLMEQGIGDRETARPYAQLWAVNKYGNIKHNSAGEQAMYRVPRRCFPKDELPQAKKQKKAAPVKFTASQRSVCDMFLAEFPGKTLQEQIKQARALLKSLEQ